MAFALGALDAVVHDRVVFACAFMKNADADTDRHVVDLRAERMVEVGREYWLLSWPGGRSIRAEAFPVQIGSIGGSTELRWTESGNSLKKAFISYSDVKLSNDVEVMFLSLDKPSVWQPPGYMCSTAALKENRQ